MQPTAAHASTMPNYASVSCIPIPPTGMASRTRRVASARTRLLLGSLLLLLLASAAASRDTRAFVRVTTSYHQQHKLPLAAISSHSRSWITTQVW